MQVHVHVQYMTYGHLPVLGSHTHQVVVEDTFTLGREKCPPGNKLKPDSSTLYYTCDCNVENEDIIDCERRTLILKVWPSELGLGSWLVQCLVWPRELELGSWLVQCLVWPSELGQGSWLVQGLVLASELGQGSWLVQCLVWPRELGLGNWLVQCLVWPRELGLGNWLVQCLVWPSELASSSVYR